MFGEAWSGRGDAVERSVRTLIDAWSGEPFEYEGRTVTVRPAPLSRPHPMLFYGGGSIAAARRAARLGLGLYPQVDDAELAERYEAECRALGHEPGMVMQPPPGPGSVFCADDPDEFWERYGHHLLHDARSYAEWHGAGRSAVRDRSTTVDAMRSAGVYAVWTPEELIERCRSREVGLVTVHPLCGGMPPEAGWASLRLIGDEVLPALRQR
jgi:alkanesulfonate monooxygenase SsuD/methylene tetrahydromethanopterin reductase-like flavin-dependent oxidoreductase (luciferase family)